MNNDEKTVSCTECGASFTLAEVRRNIVIFYDRFGHSLEGFPDDTPTDSEAQEMTRRIVEAQAICDVCENDD